MRSSALLDRRPRAPAASPRDQGAPREVRVQVHPAWPLRLTRRSGMDGLSPVRGGVLHRLLHVQDQPVHLRVAQLSCGDVLIGARASHAQHAHAAIAMMRRSLGTDLQLREFHERYRHDPLIGPAVRRDPTVRPPGRPDAFEALAWAVTEQLIEYVRAAAIQRRMVAGLGRRDEVSGLRDSPSALTLAGVAPAKLVSFDLSAGRALALTRVAREVAAGRVDLASEDPAVQEAGWRRLQTIPGIGPWTTEIMAVSAQRRLDQIPAGDLGFIKLVGGWLSGGDPYARATEQQVRDVFARFGRWQGLAASYALRVGAVSVGAVTSA